jgi:hypothetical protein
VQHTPDQADIRFLPGFERGHRSVDQDDVVGAAPGKRRRPGFDLAAEPD